MNSSDPRPSPPDRQAVLDQFVLDSAPQLTLMAGVIYGIFAFANAFLLPAGTRVNHVLMNAVTAIIYFAARWWLRDRPPPVRWAHPVIVSLALLAQVNVLHFLVHSNSPMESVRVVLVIMTVGMVVLSETWLLVLIGSCLVSWAITVAWLMPDPVAWRPMGVVLLASSIISGALHAIRIRLQRRVFRERAEEEYHVEELRSELATAHQSEERFRKLAEASFEGVLIHDERRILEANRSFCDMVDDDRSEVVGTDLLRFFAPESHGFVLAKIAQGGDAQFEVVGMRRDGVPLDLDVRMRSYIHDGAVARFSAIRDITRRKRRERDLAETLAEVRRSNLELESFAYAASHDLQAPLRTIASFAEILAEEEGDTLSVDAVIHLERIVTSVGRMERLLADLLDYSRIGTRAKTFERVELDEVFAAAVANQQAAINFLGAELNSARLPVVFGDEVQLVQLFQNLIANGLKFKSERTPRLHVNATRQDDRWRIEVRDNGIGMEERYLPRIFKIFERLHSHTEIPGTGIGLAICKRIVERHGGQISATSVFGEGSTFYFDLPAVPREARFADSPPVDV